MSVHRFGLALDCDVSSDSEVDDLYEIITSIDPALRIGRYYGAQTFIHIDVGFLILPRVKWQWREGARWVIRK